jgi:hypothetical protein
MALFSAGDFLELPNGRSVRLNKDTAEIANAAWAAGEQAECEAWVGESQGTEKFWRNQFRTNLLQNIDTTLNGTEEIDQAAIDKFRAFVQAVG